MNIVFNGHFLSDECAVLNYQPNDKAPEKENINKDCYSIQYKSAFINSVKNMRDETFFHSEANNHYISHSLLV